MRKKGLLVLALTGVMAFTSCNKDKGPIAKEKGPVAERVSHKDIYQEAYVYGFPMLVFYDVMRQFSIDKNSGQYRAPFNHIAHEARAFTYRDAADVTPNNETPYSLMMMDLRAEPVVLCMPKVEMSRYYSVQLMDMYASNYGYIGSRATGHERGCYMVAGPGWKGDMPARVKKMFTAGSQFSVAVYRTQLFDAEDTANVVKVQSGYKVQTLSSFLHKPAPAAAPVIDWPAFTRDDMNTTFPKFLNFVLQFCPPAEQEKAMRARFASVGIEAGKPFDFDKLPEAEKAEETMGVSDGFAEIEKEKEMIDDPDGLFLASMRCWVLPRSWHSESPLVRREWRAVAL